MARLGLIASHLWLFLLPTVLAGGVTGAAFWIGAAYVTVPLGLLIYGWNDFFDADVDAMSRRKKETGISRFFGYRLSPGKRKLLPACIIAAHLPFLALAIAFGEVWTLGWLALMMLGNWLYNGPGVRLSRTPVIAELVATGIYLNILWLSTVITGLPQAWEVWLLAAAAILFFQISGAIVDIRSDSAVGKITFAVWAGEAAGSYALAVIAAAKAALFWQAFSAAVPALLNLVAIPFCLARPRLPGKHWAGGAYFYFVAADWVSLGFLARGL